MAKKQGPLALIIIDGWGHSAAREGNAIALAATPFYDELSEKYPNTLLEAHGSRVGLPAGVMGNSMDVSLVDHEIETGEFFENKFLSDAMEGAKTRAKALHLMGLISGGQVHSSLTHLYALLKMAKDHGLDRVYVHCFLDGRDTPPSSASQYIAALQRKKIGGAGLDVFEIEPLPANSPLRNFNNVILTSHSASVSEMAIQSLQVKAATAACEFLKGNRLRTAIV